MNLTFPVPLIPRGLAIGIIPSFVLSASVVAPQQPEPFTVHDLRIAVAIDYEKQKLDGSVTYEIENWSPTPADSVSFIVGRLMEVTKVSDKSGARIPFSQDVMRFVDDPMRQVTKIEIRLPQPVLPGNRTTLTIDYAGNLVGYTELGWLYVKDHIDTTFTILREDALAFPVIGNLSDQANRRMPYPSFTYEAFVRVPSRYMVGLGGTMTQTMNGDETTTWHYASGDPASVMNIAIAPFDTLSKNGVRVFYFREDSVGARLLMDRTQSAMATYASWFGPLHSQARLTITEIPDGWGSQASLVGGIIQSAAAFRDPSRLGEVYHELSHLWNAREADTPAPRWNEGLATFLELMMAERLDNFAGRRDYESRLISRIKKGIASDSSLVTIPFSDYGRQHMTEWSYRVGEIMFSTLRELMGEREFNNFVGGYYQKYAANGRTRQLTDSAPANLKAFFDDWMYSTRWTSIVEKSGSVDEIAAYYRSAKQTK